MTNWEERFERKPVRTGIRFGVVALLGLMVLALVGGIGFGALNLLAQPGRVLQQTFDASNMVYNYEWFRQQYQDVQAMDGKIAVQQAAFEAAAGAERDRIASVVAGLRTKRAQMVADYNARGMMANRSIFTAGLPQQIQ